MSGVIPSSSVRIGHRVATACFKRRSSAVAGEADMLGWVEEGREMKIGCVSARSVCEWRRAPNRDLTVL